MEKDEKTPAFDPVVATFHELFDRYELWDKQHRKLPLFLDIYERIEAKEHEKEIRELIKSSSLEIVMDKEGSPNDDGRVDLVTVILLGELKVTESVERIIEIYDNALYSGSQYIRQYHHNWQQDEFADIRSVCIQALSKIDDPRAYSTIFLATREEHQYVAGDAWSELTYDRFKHAVKNYSIFDLKRLKHPLDWHLELGYDEFVDKVIAERGYEIQSNEHRIAEKLVFKDVSLEDYQTEAVYANSYSEEMKDLDLKKLLHCLVKEYQTYSLEEDPDIRGSTFVAFFFKQIGFEKVKQKLELLLAGSSDSDVTSIVEDLLSLIVNPKLESDLDQMTEKIRDDIKDSEELEKRKAEREKRKDPNNCPQCGNKSNSPECQCIQRTDVGYLTHNEKLVYERFYGTKTSKIVFWVSCIFALVVITIITIWFLTR